MRVSFTNNTFLTLADESNNFQETNIIGSPIVRKTLPTDRLRATHRLLSTGNAVASRDCSTVICATIPCHFKDMSNRQQN